MKKIGKILGVIVLLAVTAAVAAEVAQNAALSGTWRYKITVMVETPEGIKTGSTVREVRGTVNLNPLPEERGAGFRTFGEAVVVDLGKGRKVFGLIDWQTHEEVFKALPQGTEKGEWSHVVKYYQELKSGTKGVLPQNAWPKFVTFKDLNDPKSIELVWAGEFYDKPHENGIGSSLDFRVGTDRFEELFGQGVKLKEVEIEITDEPVVRKIDKYLPSFGEETGFWKWFEKLPYGDPRRIGPNNFK